jgi:hypothetical protein
MYLAEGVVVGCDCGILVIPNVAPCRGFVFLHRVQYFLEDVENREREAGSQVLCDHLEGLDLQPCNSAARAV